MLSTTLKLSATAAITLILAGCGSPPKPVIDGVTINMVQVTNGRTHNGGVETFFSFSPPIDRSWEKRVSLAKAAAEARGCEFLDLPLQNLMTMTAKQTSNHVNKILIAPTIC